MATITRPAGAYTPANPITNTTKYQLDSAATASISSVKVDGDINKAYDTLSNHDNSLAGQAVQIANLESAIPEYADSVFRIKGSADDTKKLAIEVDGLTTSTTRTLTAPDVNGTLVTSGNLELSALYNSGYNTTGGGQYYRPLMAVGTDAAVAANVLYGVPFIVTKAQSFGFITVRIATLAAGNVRLGIYTMVNGLPGTLVQDIGTASTGTTGLKNITYGGTLQPGFYVLAALFDATPTVTTCIDSGGIAAHYIGAGAGNINVTVTGFRQASVTYGALPSTWTVNASSSSTDVPMLALKIS